MSKSRISFSISTLLIATTVIVIHCAFPALLTILFYTFVFALVLSILVFPVFAAVVLTSPAGNGQLDVGRNLLFLVLVRLYVLALVLFYAFRLWLVIF